MSSQSADDNLARLLQEVNFLDEQSVKDLKLEPRTFQPLRIQFTRKSKKVPTNGGNAQSTRRKRRKRAKSNKENQVAPKGIDECFLQEWHDDEVEIADFRSSDDSQDEQLEEWYKDLKSNKARDVNLPPANGSDTNVGPVIRDESSCEGKSWLQTDIADTYLLDMMAKYPSSDDSPCGIVFDDLMDPRRWIEKTHLMAEEVMTMEKSRIFTILRQNRPRNLLAHLRLGYCVTYIPGRPICQQEGRTCALECHLCGVCCHMYSCTCRLIKRFQWCSHMHAAVLCGGNKFKNDQQVYVHLSSRYTQLSHLRATCFDMTNDVKPVEDNPAAFAVMGWATEWTPFSVLRSPLLEVCHVCPQYKRCPECFICRHQYLCACAEFMVQKRLCEHCHVVAIFLSENRVKTLKKREFRYLSDVSDYTDEEPDPSRDTSPVLLPFRKIRAHHEKSYSIPLKRIQVGSVHDQLVYFVQRCDPSRRFVVHARKKANCTSSKDTMMPYLDCADCRMCCQYLKCNCGVEETEFCKHVHAVRRYIVRSFTPADRMLESALGNTVKGIMSDFFGSYDMSQIDCGPLQVSDENIMVVVESLKAALQSQVELELQNADELVISGDSSVRNRVKNLEAVLEVANQVLNSKEESNDRILGEVDGGQTSNSDSSKTFEPVSRKTNDSDSMVVEEYSEKLAAKIIGHSASNSNSTMGIDQMEQVSSNCSDQHSPIIPVEIHELDPGISDPSESSEQNLKADLEESCVSESKAEVVAVNQNPDGEGQLQLIQKSDSIVAIPVNELEVETQLSSYPKDDSTNVDSVKQSADESDNDESVREKLTKSTVADTSIILDLTCDNLQLDPILKESIDGTDTSRMSGDEALSDVNGNSFLCKDSSGTLNNPVLQNDRSTISGAGIEDKNEVSTSFDFSSIKTLPSFYRLQFEPVMQVHYKDHAEPNEELPKVLAESKRCVVTVRDSPKESSTSSRPALQQNFFWDNETKEAYRNKVPEKTEEISSVSRNFELPSTESCPNLNPALPKNFSYNFGPQKDNRNSTRTCSSSHVEPNNTEVSKTSESGREILPRFSSIRRRNEEKLTIGAGVYSGVGKSEDWVRNCRAESAQNSEVWARNCRAESAHSEDWARNCRAQSAHSENWASNCRTDSAHSEDWASNCRAESARNAEPVEVNLKHSFPILDTAKENERLVPEEESHSTNFGETVKRKSMNLIKKLNFSKLYKKKQKEETSFSQLFGNMKWPRSRQQREFAVLQSISDEFADTDVIFENLDLP